MNLDKRSNGLLIRWSSVQIVHAPPYYKDASVSFFYYNYNNNTMIVKKDKVVEMHYTLKNDAGEVIDSSKSQGPMPFIQGHGNIIPGLESALEGMKVGESCDVSIKPEDAYGVYIPEAIQEIPMDALKEIDNLAVGMELESRDNDGNRFIVHVKSINKDTVTVDANHPLAGETLHFNVSIENIREPSEDEFAHGHIHSGTCSH